MEFLVNGHWKPVWYDTKTTQDEFKCMESVFRKWITAGGQAGSTGISGVKAEANRYHLYVSLACPWAHRALIILGINFKMPAK